MYITDRFGCQCCVISVLPGLVESIQNKVQTTRARGVTTKRETHTVQTTSAQGVMMKRETHTREDDDVPPSEKDDDSVPGDLDMTLQVCL